jgi:hypothetical protein
MDGILSAIMRNAGQGIGVPQGRRLLIPAFKCLVCSGLGHGDGVKDGNPTSAREATRLGPAPNYRWPTTRRLKIGDRGTLNERAVLSPCPSPSLGTFFSRGWTAPERPRQCVAEYPTRERRLILDGARGTTHLQCGPAIALAFSRGD